MAEAPIANLLVDGERLGELVAGRRVVALVKVNCSQTVPGSRCRLRDSIGCCCTTALVPLACRGIIPTIRITSADPAHWPWVFVSDHGVNSLKINRLIS